MAKASQPVQQHATISLSPSPEAPQGLTLRHQASQLAVIDKASHERGLEFLKGAKQLQRKITDHWANITRSVDDLKRNLLNLKKADLEPVEAAIAHAEKTIVGYVNAERQRQQAEQDRLRKEAEDQARTDREAALAAAEVEAQRLEAASDDLSAREQTFVDGLLDGLSAATAAENAGYKNPAQTAERLVRTPKILAAYAAAQSAKAIREQAAITAETPLTVAVEAAPSQLGKVVGTSLRTTYSCEIVDAKKLYEAFRKEELGPLGNLLALVPDETFLNSQAKQIKDAELFAAAYPGCKLVTRQGIAG